MIACANSKDPTCVQACYPICAEECYDECLGPKPPAPNSIEYAIDPIHLLRDVDGGAP